MGYPKCTKEAVESACKWKRQGMSNKDIAACLHINERTFYRWLNEPKTENQRQLGQSIRACEAEYKLAIRQRIIKASDEDWRAGAWILSHQYPEEYAENRVEQFRTTDSDAAPTFVYER